MLTGANALSVPNGKDSKAASMWVKRDAAWLSHAAPRLGKLLTSVLTPLCLHPAHAVRGALASGTGQLVRKSGLLRMQNQPCCHACR